MKTWGLALAAALVLALFAWRMKPDSSGAPAPAAPHEPSAAAASASASIETATETRKPNAQTLLTERTPTSDAHSSTASMPTGILVRGSVRDEHGQPVVGESLYWIDELGVRRCANILDGSYSLAGLLAGHYLVTAGINGRAVNQTDVTLDPTPAIQQHDFTIHVRPEIMVRIVSADGAPLIGLDAEKKPLPGNRLRVRASRGPPPDLLDPSALRLQARSDCAGFGTRWDYGSERPRMAPDCIGILVLDEPPPLYVSLVYGNAVVATQRIEDAPPEIVFRLSAESLISRRAGLRLRLLAPDGKTPVTQGSGMLSAGTSLVGKTDAHGQVEILDVLPGAYSLMLEALGHTEREGRSVVLEPGQVLDLGDIALAKRMRQSVRFTFAGESQPPVQFVLKREYPGDPDGTLGPHDNETYSTLFKNPVEMALPEAGTYELRVVRVGEPAGYESTHLGARPLRLVIGDQPASEIVVPIEPTSEICLRPPRASSGISRWIVATVDGLPCQRVRIEGRAPTRIELVPGEYTIARLDPETGALGALQAIRVGTDLLTVELRP